MVKNNICRLWKAISYGNNFKEIRNNDNFILYSDTELCPSFLIDIMELIAFYGALIIFIILIIIRSVRKFTTKALHFPFSLTYFGKGLYLYLLIFLIVNFGIDLIFVRHIDILTNHHANKDQFNKQCFGGFLLFTIGLVYLFFSICGILGTLFFIAGDIDSNGNLYIKTACLDSDISCYGLFQFASSFPLDNKIYSKIFYYIYIKKISKSDQAQNMVSLIMILLIYFCQFYSILFDKILDFNFDKARYGKCVVNDYIIKDKSELYLIDNINVHIDYREQYYKNYLNDSYFNTFKNNNNTNDIKGKTNAQILGNSGNIDKAATSGRTQLPPINTNVIRITSNLKNNK